MASVSGRFMSTGDLIFPHRSALPRTGDVGLDARLRLFPRLIVSPQGGEYFHLACLGISEAGPTDPFIRAPMTLARRISASRIG
jgi:hypothetical protein